MQSTRSANARAQPNSIDIPRTIEQGAVRINQAQLDAARSRKALGGGARVAGCCRGVEGAHQLLGQHMARLPAIERVCGQQAGQAGQAARWQGGQEKKSAKYSNEGSEV